MKSAGVMVDQLRLVECRPSKQGEIIRPPPLTLVAVVFTFLDPLDPVDPLDNPDPMVSQDSKDSVGSPEIPVPQVPQVCAATPVPQDPRVMTGTRECLVMLVLPALLAPVDLMGPLECPACLE